MQAFLVALAMEILKYYAPKGVNSFFEYWKEQDELKKNKEKAGNYQKVVGSPAGREERRKVEDELLG